jgi:hypothetical protein
MTCRLPQTPRTPTTAAAHYFDEIFTGTGRPKKPHHLRRSSTARSIGHRSDWGASTTGDEDTTPLARVNSIGYLNQEDIRRKSEIDQHVAHYVSDQIQRLKTNQDNSSVDEKELETSLDGAADDKANGHQNGKDGYFDQSH